MSKKIFIVLTIIGFSWGVWGGHIIGQNPPLVFGWIPLTIVSLSLTGIFASILNYLFFKNYANDEVE